MKQQDINRIIEQMPLTRQAFARLPKPKYNFSRNWYVAEIGTDDYDEVRAWCKEQFGEEDKFPNAWSRWQHRYEHQIFIRDEKDYNWFVLRWGA